jgi:hypothetical protein
MTKEQALNLIKLLSGIESWSFTTVNGLPDYLHDDLCIHVKVLEAIVLEKNT